MITVFFGKVGSQAQGKSVFHCDNQSATHLARNPIFHARTKHI